VAVTHLWHHGSVNQNGSFDKGRYRGQDLSENQACMFCGEPADSREDIVPTWIAKQRLVPPGDLQPVTYWSHGVAVHQWSSQTLAFLKIKGVCNKCNNEWMSRIDAAAKKHLLVMMQGDTIHLDPAAQVELATWACLKAMVWESVAEGVVTSSHDREEIWKRQLPPAYAVVVLGRVPVADHSEFGLQNVFVRAQRQPGASFDNVSATAVTLGDFVDWVILNPTALGRADFKPTPIDDDLITIYPPSTSTLQWPPLTALTLEEVRSVWRRYMVVLDEVKVEHQPDAPGTRHTP
jgi:hypothetical protein